jgi:hypothetical protein
MTYHRVHRSSHRDESPRLFSAGARRVRARQLIVAPGNITGDEWLV